MQIVRDLAGYSMGRSDLVRRAMAKKKHDVMEKEKEYFINGKMNEDGTVDVPGAVRMGVSKEAAEKLFDEMTSFASYAFNKSHAAAYGVVAVQTGWLKKHYPTEFMAALINSIAGSSEKVAYYIEYCRKNGIEIAPPDVNRSMEKFSVDMSSGKKMIRFGLNAVKNVGHGAIRSIIEVREKGGLYKDLYDFAERNAGHLVNKKAVESLIKAGAFDSVPGNRAQKMCVFEKAMDSASKKSSTVLAGQISLFGEMSEIASPTPPLPPLQEFGRRQILSMEKEVTGIYVSGHPLEEYASQLSKLDINARYLSQYAEEKTDGGMSIDQMKVKMGGILTDKRVKATKSGGMMAIVNLEDMYGTTEALAFPRVYERVKDKLIEDTVVLITGRLSAREDETPKLLIDTVYPLETDQETQSAAPNPKAEKPENPKKLYLKLSRNQLDAVEFILETSPGTIPVYFYFPDEKKTFRAPMNLWVSDDYDKDGLEGLLGAGSVVMK